MNYLCSPFTYLESVSMATFDSISDSCRLSQPWSPLALTFVSDTLESCGVLVHKCLPTKQ